MANIRVRADRQISPKHSRFQQSAAKCLNSPVHSEVISADAGHRPLFIMLCLTWFAALSWTRMKYCSWARPIGEPISSNTWRIRLGGHKRRFGDEIWRPIQKFLSGWRTTAGAPTASSPSATSAHSQFRPSTSATSAPMWAWECLIH